MEPLGTPQGPPLLGPDTATRYRPLGPTQDPGVGEGGRTREGGTTERSGFARELVDALQEVDGLQQESAEQAAAMARGEPVDLHEVLVSMEKSDVSFRLMLEVRNRLLDAWQNLSRTPI